jgi:hypothetical protein
VTPESVSKILGEFLAGSRGAVVLEDGAVTFDLATARYSISGEYNKCLLHLWSAERNVVRRVLDAEVKAGSLRLAVQRMGQARPSRLEICRDRDRRSPSARRAARSAYQQKFRRMLERRFFGFTVSQLSTNMDLERSFGPVHARGIIKKGQSAFAVLGVNDQETQASIDAALTFGILWLDACREAQSDRTVVEGLQLFVPPKSSGIVRERIAHLNQSAAKWHLYEFDERHDEVMEIDCSDRGNIATRLVRCPDFEHAYERFAGPIATVAELLPECAAVVISPAEIAFRLHGLELARARIAHSPTSFHSGTEIVFGVGAEERVLEDRNRDDFIRLLHSAGEVRHAEGPRDHPLWRMHPERWLESLVIGSVDALDDRLDAAHLYSQVPAFSAADRAMIDVLTVTRSGRLAVVELKADEDIHLPLQGLDYWARVEWHHARGEFKKFGYFEGRELSDEQPILILVAPALRVHPATDALLRYFSPEIAWEFLGIDERWRQGVRVVFRKRAGWNDDPRTLRFAEEAM